MVYRVRRCAAAELGVGSEVGNILLLPTLQSTRLTRLSYGMHNMPM